MNSPLWGQRRLERGSPATLKSCQRLLRFGQEFIPRFGKRQRLGLMYLVEIVTPGSAPSSISNKS
jgi:hypothetical protein